MPSRAAQALIAALAEAMCILPGSPPAHHTGVTVKDTESCSCSHPNHLKLGSLQSFALDTPMKVCPKLLQPGDSLDPRVHLQMQGCTHHWPLRPVRQTPWCGLARQQASCMRAWPFKGRLQPSLSRHTCTGHLECCTLAHAGDHRSVQSLCTCQDAGQNSPHPLWDSTPSVRDPGHGSTAS